MCIFMSMIFILILIKSNIEINSNELFKTIWEHKRRKKKLIVTANTQQHRAQVYIYICVSLEESTPESNKKNKKPDLMFLLH
jgi:hypothetical protein